MSDSTHLPTGYSGRDRGRRTPRTVRVAEAVARWLIALGGIGTIFAVSLIFLFLVWVVLPLFQDGELTREATHVGAIDRSSDVIAIGGDELQLMGWSLHRDGTVRTFRMDSGQPLGERQVFDGQATAWSTTPHKGGISLCVGFSDGSIRSGAITFKPRYLVEDAIPETLRLLKPGESAPHAGTMVVVTPRSQHRVQELEAVLGEPLAALPGTVVIAVDHSRTPSGEAWAILGSNGKLVVYRKDSSDGEGEDADESEEIFGGDEPERLDLPYRPDKRRGAPFFVGINGVGLSLFVLWKDGHLERYSLSDFVDSGGPVESQDLVGAREQVTAARFLIGKMTLLVGDSSGSVRAWFETKPESAGTGDGAVLRAAHEFNGAGGAVRVISPSARSRLIAVGDDAGTLRLLHVTTAVELARDNVGAPIRNAAILPKNDGLLAATTRGLTRWQLDVGHPEVTLGSLFDKVWYEGYEAPSHTWESTGPNGFEPKLGLIPLIFGTLKATLYSILLAAPIAFLAAMFTSEFLSPRLRTPIKSAVEMMAGLPSVVLGFLAALVIAPYVQQVVPTMLAAFATVPLMLLFGSRGWQFLPTRTAVRWGGAPRFFAIALMIPAGVWIATLVGPQIETAMFWVERTAEDGTVTRVADIRQWLSAHGKDNTARSSGVGGWTFLLLPLFAVLVAVFWTLVGAPKLRIRSAQWSRRRCAVADLVKFIALFAVIVLGAGAVGAFLAGPVGWDPRGGVLDAYAQRNALIVGFVMGFAVVPIIYTLAEDALSSVPAQLREGSLGCGATRWQTAWRITIPTAMSGLFGALMVGLGRAVGETMIVLMAAGNTAIQDWNIFNGFRTLSANLATEMPEAAVGGTHYRALFLAALVLFVLTFLINMGAEAVRRVFRRRFADL